MGYGEFYKWVFWKGNKMGKIIFKRRSNFKEDWADICIAREIEILNF